MTDNNFKSFAPRPPMGWNSWDCYGASVNEEQLRGNALYMAEHLKAFGWEYVVCDIQWYEPCAKSTEYNAFYPLAMDEYSRLIPAVNRFPSSAGGAGFKPIADYIHGLGLKFGIHIMRGIPRQAVHRNTPILGTDKRARDVAQSYSVCPWNTDMYGVNTKAEGAREYYCSLFALYAEWGVDFVKVDDIANTEFKPHDCYSAADEIEMIRAAIDHCGRPIVLSLSPGPAPLSHEPHLRKNANMWRMTGDFWDSWQQLKGMFERCKAWYRYAKGGTWPDCDMIPIGRISINNDPARSTERKANFTPDEAQTLMTLWCIFRSPLMLGCELRDLDEETLALFTNEDVLEMNLSGHGQKPLDTGNLLPYNTVAWVSQSGADDGAYLALFNLGDKTCSAALPLAAAGLTPNTSANLTFRDLWKKEDTTDSAGILRTDIPPHGVKLYKFFSC